MEKVKNKIKELRISKNLTQQQLANELHVTKQAISKWEKGKSIPDITSIELLSSFFGVSTDYLINDSVESKHETPTAIFSKHKSKLKVVLISALIVMVVAIVALSITLGIILNKDDGNLDIPLGNGHPDKVAVNGFEITYLTEETHLITKTDKTVILNFNIYNSTDFNKTCVKENFAINHELVNIKEYLYIDYIYPNGYTIAPHEELKISMRIAVNPSFENLGAIPCRSATVSYAGQTIATILW